MKTTNKQAGFSLIELLIVVAIIGIIAAIAIPNLLASRKAANESAAVGTLRTIGSAQATYQSTTGNGSYGTAAQLNTAKLIDDTLKTAVTATPASKGGHKYAISFDSAKPGEFEVTAARLAGKADKSYYTDEAGVISYLVSDTPGVRATPGTTVGN